ncbi:MAG: hypothetical protein WBX01_13710 [Nitrososphaeraceae archaeon]
MISSKIFGVTLLAAAAASIMFNATGFQDVSVLIPNSPLYPLTTE